MNIAKKIIERNAGLLTSLLIYQEFSFEEANRFLPQAVKMIVDVVTSELDVQLLASGVHAPVATLMQKIDCQRLEAVTGVDSTQAKSGLDVLLPKLLELLGGDETLFCDVPEQKPASFDVLGGPCVSMFRSH